MNKYIVITTINEAIQKPKVFNTHKEAVEEVERRIEKEMEGHCHQFTKNDWAGYWIKSYKYAIRKVRF